MRRGARVVLKVGVAVAAAAAVVALLMVLAGVFHDKVDTEAARPGPRAGGGAAAGSAIEVVAEDVPQAEWAVGTVRAVQETTLGARLMATVLQVHVEAGQDVAEGELLVELDDRDLKARVEQAAAQVDVAQAAWDQAKSDFERVSRLAPEGGASPFELSTVSNALKAAEAEHQRAVSDLHEAQTVLTYAQISAPVAGRIVDKLVDVGDIVSPGQPLVTMYDPTRMQLVATVRESLRERLEVGQTVGVKLEAMDHECEATISEIVPQAETATRSFEVKVTGPCPPGVYPGMFGRLRVPLDDRRAVCIPASAVRQVGQLDLVDVVETGDRLQRRLVQLGQVIDDQRVEVLSGLAPGERVILPAAPAPSSEASRGN